MISTRGSIVINTGHQASTPFGHETPADLVHKFVFLADDRNIARVWVGGALVKEIKD